MNNPVNILVLFGTGSGTVQWWQVVPVLYRCIRYKIPIRYFSIHVLHTFLVHVPVPYTSIGLVTGSGTAVTNMLCNGTRNGIKQYRFCTGSVSLSNRVRIALVLGSVSLLYWVSIAFVAGQYRFCTG